MDVRTHFYAGLRLVLKTPSLVAWVYLTSLVVAFPLALAMKDLLQGSFEGSLVEDNLRQGFDPAWSQEFAATSTGLGKTSSAAQADQRPLSPHPLRSKRTDPGRVRGALHRASGSNLRVCTRHGGRHQTISRSVS